MTYMQRRYVEQTVAHTVENTAAFLYRPKIILLLAEPLWIFIPMQMPPLDF